MATEPEIGTRFEMLAPFLNERTRRPAAAAEAAAIGRGGVARATGVSRQAIASGLTRLQAPDDLGRQRIRRPGGGRERAVGTDATPLADPERLIGPAT